MHILVTGIELSMPQKHKRHINGVYSFMMRVLLVTIVAFSLGAHTLHSQNTGFYPEQDTLADVDPDYTPRVKARIFAGRPGKAALYSLILPGAGQAYNKKYWQVPIVWAGVGTAGVIMATNIKDYKGYRDAYRERLLAAQEMREPGDKYVGSFTTNDLLNYRDRWNRYRQLSIIAFALTWIANSAQAYVGVHLKDFDISEDLSLQIQPFSASDLSGSTMPVSTGLVLRF